MYITIKSIKRNYGFKGLELSDIIIAIPLILIFIILFCFTNFKIFSLIGLLVGIFCLLPINISKKNRMYKILILIIRFWLKDKIYVYISERKENNVE